MPAWCPEKLTVVKGKPLFCVKVSAKLGEKLAIEQLTETLNVNILEAGKNGAAKY